MEVALAVAEPSGEFLIVWSADDGDGRSLFARLYDGDGDPLSGVTPVSDTAGLHSNPDVAADGRGPTALN